MGTIKRKTSLLLAIVSLVFTHFSQATNVSANSKATATLASVCTIGSQNVNFGTIILPVSSQTAISSMNVQCTKNSSFTIGLAYGGVYGQGQAPNGDYWLWNGCVSACSTGSPIGQWIEYSSTGQQINFGDFVSGTYPPNTTKSNIYVSVRGYEYTVNGSAYTYGMINGVAHGDSVAYSIQIPNKPSEVWNTGNYSYSSTGTGFNQSIPVVATLQPSNTVNKYPTPDSYLDIITATITY